MYLLINIDFYLRTFIIQYTFIFINQYPLIDQYTCIFISIHVYSEQYMYMYML